MINFGNISIADLRLGATQVGAAYLGNNQVWSLGPVVPKYDIQSIGRSIFQQGTSIEITEQAGDTITLYIKTNATDLTNKQVCAAVYLNSTDVTPYASFAFSNVSLTGRYITGITPDVSEWVPSGFPETYSTLYMKTWIQDAGSIDPADALGEVLDWTGTEHDPLTEPLCFTAISNYGTIRLNKNGSPDDISLEVSRDNIIWNDYTIGTGIEINSSNNNKVYFRAKGQNSTISKNSSNYYDFTVPSSTAGFKFEASGNIQTLLKADGSRTDAPAYCYYRMFSNCTSLTTAPALPAMALATYCYSGMFNGCTSLTTAPALPAMALADSCYNSMFYNCSSLNSMKVSFIAWSPTNATQSWLYNVAESGTFTCPAALPNTRGPSNIPLGWTKTESADSPLTFTAEQANSTVHLDKVGSPDTISLETSTDGSTWTDYTWSDSVGSTLTLANVGDKVYIRAKTENQTIGSTDSNYYKFIMTGKIAASGNIQTLLKADGSRTDAPAYCYLNIFRDCTALTTASITLPAMTLNNACYQDMFGACSSLTTGPAVLPATTLVNNCYGGMFHRCSSLTAAPKLSATALVYNSCNNMFLYCSALSSIEVVFTSWTSGATGNWMLGVAASGTFTCPAELPDTRGPSNIPSGWTKAEPTVKYLRITSLEDGSSVQLSAIADERTPVLDLECRRVGTGTWNQYTYGTSLSIDKDEAVEFRAGPNGNKRTSYYNDWPYFNTFVGTGKFAASGNIGTLLQADGNLSSYDFNGTNNNGKNVFNRLFYGSLALIDATQVEFPAIYAPERAYADMFKDCTNLLCAPSCIASPILGMASLQSLLENTPALSACVKQIDATYLGEAATYYFNSNSNVRDEVILMGNVTEIDRYNFNRFYCILDFSRCTQVPVLRNSYLGTVSKVIVPDALYDAWIVATNWSSDASKIVKHSEFYPNS